MLFMVKVVPQAEYDAAMKRFADLGQTGLIPVDASREQMVPADADKIPAPARDWEQLMTSTTFNRQAQLPSAAKEQQRRAIKGRTFVKWVTTTDHKVIGNLYFITSFIFFLLGGVMALIIRAELFAPGLQVVDNPEQYNQLFTMHGTIMLLLFATPLFAGFTNALMPLQIGAPDVAFPRLNMFAYWLYLFGGLIASAGFLTPQGAAAFGWFAYAPLSDVSYSPGSGR